VYPGSVEPRTTAAALRAERDLAGSVVLWPTHAPSAVATLDRCDFLRREHYEIVEAVAATASDQILVLSEHLARTTTIPNVRPWVFMICDAVDESEATEAEVHDLIREVRRGSLERQLRKALRSLAENPLDNTLRRGARALYGDLAAMDSGVAA